MLMVDQSGTIVLVNSQIEKLFGYSRDELIGSPVKMLVPERSRAKHPEYQAEYLKSPETRPMGKGRDLYGVRKDGSEVPVEIGLNPLTTPEGRFVLSSVVDITQRIAVQRHLEAQRNDLDQKNREREVLLKEVYHRTKNNLQVISSLLNLQADQITDPRSRELFEESRNRVYSIALVHEQLYQSTDLAWIDCAEYVAELIAHLQSIFSADSSVIVDAEVNDVRLPVDIAVPTGLIINELVTNALKHAFPHGVGRVAVKMSRADDEILIVVTDDGIGLPNELDVRVARSLGLELVAKLSKQLQASVTIARQHGTTFALRFNHAQ